MKVYIGYECYYNYRDEFKNAVKVFDCEEKALVWKESFVETETNYRAYEEMELE